MLIGYARVSTEDQVMLAQVDALRAAGCAEIIEEYGSGGDRSRPLLAKALARVGRGDTLVVARIDRLARSVSHLLAVVEGLKARGAHFRSLGDPIDTTSPQGVFTLQVIGAVAEFERALIRERTLAGLAAARARGRVGGNPALRDPARRGEVDTARRAANIKRLAVSADDWLPTVERLRPASRWVDVVAAVNRGGDRQWSPAALIRAVRALVDAGRADRALLVSARRAPAPDRLVAVVAGIHRGNAALSLRAIGAELQAMGERTPRGEVRWSPSSVSHIVNRARRAGLLRG